jgi:hypothetical protein
MYKANAFAYAALLLWPFLSAYLFSKFRPTIAAAVVLLGAAMFLPERVQLDAPVLPAFTKHSAGALCAWLGCLWRCPARLREARRSGRLLNYCVVVMVLGQVVTALTNGDELRFGPTTLQAMGLYDSVSFILSDLITIYLPLHVARAVYRSPADLEDFLRVLVGAGLLYSLGAWLEMRLSPQLHNWLYGFHQHAFGQTKRYGAYRPVLFFEHGLDAAKFFFSCTLGSVALAAMRSRVGGLPMRGVQVYFFVVVAALRSTGIWIYALLSAPLVFLLGIKARSRVASLLAVLVLSYPVIRWSGWLPEADMLDAAAGFGEDRAQSLSVRFVNEAQLLERAMDRPWFGWGGYARNRVYDEYGVDISVTDGLWARILGSQGIVGFVAYFGLLLVPIWTVARRLLRVRPDSHIKALSIVCLLAAILAVDLLPNGQHDYLQFVFAGVLAAQSLLLGRSGSALSASNQSLPPNPALNRGPRVDPLV